jgi:hypothetical protein
MSNADSLKGKTREELETIAAGLEIQNIPKLNIGLLRTLIAKRMDARGVTAAKPSEPERSSLEQNTAELNANTPALGGNSPDSTNADEASGDEVGDWPAILEEIQALQTENQNLRDEIDRLMVAQIAKPAAVARDESFVPLRRLWEYARKYGATIRDQFDREGIEASLKAVGYEEQAPEVVTASDYWEFRSRRVGTGPISAVDVDGSYSIDVYPDGHCVMTHHPDPLSSRRAGIHYKDEIWTIPNLDEFVMRMLSLPEACDEIFEESAAVTIAERKAEAEKVAEDPAIPSIHGANLLIGQMRLIQTEFGLYGKHEPSIDQLPFKLAQGLGIPLVTDDGEAKDWPTLAHEVLKKNPPPSHVAGPAMV